MHTEHSSDHLGDLAAALASVQATMRAAVKDASNPHLRSSYADLSSVWAAAQPELGKAGLALVQTCEDSDGVVYLATTLLHASGGWIRGRLRIEAQEQKGITRAQALGSALTYARRYSLAAILGVVTEDDDGATAGPRREQMQAPQQRQAPRQSDNGQPQQQGEDENIVGLQFRGALDDAWKTSLKQHGFVWNGERFRWQAEVTEKSVVFARRCVEETEAVKWSRIPEMAAA